MIANAAERRASDEIATLNVIRNYASISTHPRLLPITNIPIFNRHNRHSFDVIAPHHRSTSRRSRTTNVFIVALAKSINDCRPAVGITFLAVPS